MSVWCKIFYFILHHGAATLAAAFVTDLCYHIHLDFVGQSWTKRPTLTPSMIQCYSFLHVKDLCYRFLLSRMTCYLNWVNGWQVRSLNNVVSVALTASHKNHCTTWIKIIQKRSNPSIRYKHWIYTGLIISPTFVGRPNTELCHGIATRQIFFLCHAARTNFTGPINEWKYKLIGKQPTWGRWRCTVRRFQLCGWNRLPKFENWLFWSLHR